MLAFYIVGLAILGVTYGTQNTSRTLLGDAANSMGAVCMDGTPAAYYFSPGTEKNKWILYFEGV